MRLNEMGTTVVFDTSNVSDVSDVSDVSHVSGVSHVSDVLAGLPRALVAICVLLVPPQVAFAQTQIINDFLRAVVQPNGDWSVGTTGGSDGDADMGDDNDKRLVYSTGDTASTIVEVDGALWVLRGEPCEPVTSTANSVQLTWRFADLIVSRELRFAASTTGNPDMVRIATTVQNVSSRPHSIGVMVGIDTMIGANDAAPLYTDLGIIRDEVDFVGAEVPRQWQAFEVDDVGNPGLTAQGILTGMGATPPDRFLLGYWYHGVGLIYDVEASGERIGPDTAVAMWWDPRLLHVGGVWEVVTYYGVGGGTTVVGDLALNVTSPSVLAVVDGTLTPNPFVVSVVVENQHRVLAEEVETTLTLPLGLSLVAPGPTVFLGDIDPGATAMATWEIRVDENGGGANGPIDLSEGTPAAFAVLDLVNDPLTDVVRLDVQAGLDSRAALNIIAHRDGPDERLGTTDDDLFDSIAELDAVSYVGVVALEKLAAFSIANGYLQGSAGAARYTLEIAAKAINDTEVYVARRDIEVPPIPQSLEGFGVAINTIDIGAFPWVSMLLSVTDRATGHCVPDLDATSFRVTEDGVAMLACEVTEIADGYHVVPADIVFVLDVTGSMAEEIAALKENVLGFANALAGSGIDYRLGLVAYAEGVVAMHGMTSDSSEFRSWVRGQPLEEFGVVENPLDAIATALSLPLRPQAERIFVLATDETYNEVTTTMAQTAQTLAANNIQLVAVLPSELQVAYQPLVVESGGRFFDIGSSFGEVLDDMGEVLINRYRLRCETPTAERNNSWRQIAVEVSDGEKGGEDSGRYFVEGGALRLEPGFVIAAVGSELAVSVVADSVSGLHAAHLVMSFDPSYLELRHVEVGELLGRDASAPPVMNYGVNHAPGRGILEVDVARNHNQGTDGTGVVAIMTFALTGEAPPDLAIDGTEDPAIADDIVLDTDAVYLERSDLSGIRLTAFSHCDVDTRSNHLIGDFDRDGDIDLGDFDTLAANWGSTSATIWGATGGDIAPVSGTLPNLVVHPDGIANYKDLFVFTGMWSWFRLDR